jgi:hypothetical protein
MEDIYKELKLLEERHVRAVRGLEKLAKALEHVRVAREDLNQLSEEQNLTPTLADVPEQLKAVEDALEAETWRTRADITDVELDQTYLRSRLPPHEEDPTGI